MAKGKGKKKKGGYTCWYCKRELIDEKTLIIHQQNKHYKCPSCKKVLYSSRGLVAHAFNIHKLSITTVPNALPGSDSIEHTICGLQGVPSPSSLDSSSSTSSTSTTSSTSLTSSTTISLAPNVSTLSIDNPNVLVQRTLSQSQTVPTNTLVLPSKRAMSSQTAVANSEGILIAPLLNSSLLIADNVSKKQRIASISAHDITAPRFPQPPSASNESFLMF